MQAWPMKEFLIFVENGTLLPVNYGNLTHNQIETMMTGSQYADRDVDAWKILVYEVMGVTYIKHTQSETGTWIFYRYILASTCM